MLTVFWSALGMFGHGLVSFLVNIPDRTELTPEPGRHNHRGIAAEREITSVTVAGCASNGEDVYAAVKKCWYIADNN